MSQLFNCILQRNNQLLANIKPCNIEIIRGAAKRGKTSTQNAGNSKAKHRTWKKSDGQLVHTGEILVTQMWTRFHPGLHVIMGKNGTLNTLVTGKVIVSCEEAKPDWTHTWIQRHYAGRENTKFYKKYFNVIPDKEHGRFKLKDMI